ncbi:DNA methyltransferase [Levilactobacillus hammesii]|uniref:site-specific DNA-methyltransferase (adenine-specific) n=1 Tax=Levilactobacillus hammesii DSM 16381 TaxID=1423753 RepID=A0A0R1UZF2_9LACO|nr:DNA methyltransferase [Levilactobacillus hammesii]KRL96194.1 YeeA protein [Levilactobacillus hammesii DSM 16381]
MSLNDAKIKTRKQMASEFSQLWIEPQKGREDADRQTFWNSMLEKVFGIVDYERYIEYEKNVRVKEDNGDIHTKQIDAYIPATRVVIEMKGREKDLAEKIRQSDGKLLTPFEQAWRYSNNLPVEETPKWILVSNFNEIEIHDMSHPHDEPKIVKLVNFKNQYRELAFLIDKHQQRVIEEKQISIDAGNLVVDIYNELINAYTQKLDLKDKHVQRSLNMLVVRLVFLMYVDDTALFGKENMFQAFVERREPHELQGAIKKLFKVLDEDPNKQERDPYLDDEYNRFPYVNGGMFSDEDILIPQFTPHLKKLIVEDAGRGFNWSAISPTIFGAVFESTLNPDTRRSGGMHYTSIDNIHNIIDPLFLNDLQNELDKIKNWGRTNERVEMARQFRDKLGKLKFLDPACGSGNFLTETYLSLRSMEDEVILIEQGDLTGLGLNGFKVKINNFYGIEINDFAVSVAKTAMWIAEAQTMQSSQNKGIYVNRDFFPLVTNVGIHEGNALRMNWSDIVQPYELNYIMGNPPFIGLSSLPKEDKALKASQTDDMNIVFQGLPKHGKLDYVCAWYEKAALYMRDTTLKAAFVSTNSITQGEQVSILWKHLLKDYKVKIIFAYRSFIWNNEVKDMAHVHCVIVGFTRVQTDESVWLYDSEKEKPKRVNRLNGYLIDFKDVYIQSRKRILGNTDLPEMHQGSKPIDGGGLVLSESERDDFIKKYPDLSDLVQPYLGSSEFIKGKTRYCLWLKDVNPSRYINNPEIKRRLEIVVDKRLASTTDSVKEKDSKTPYLFTQIRQPVCDYLAVPEVSSENREYIPIGFLPKSTISSNKLYLIPTTERWIFSILISSVHMAWMRTVAGRMKSDYSYSPAVYTNFPWLELDSQTKEKLSVLGQNILDARDEFPDTKLATLYSTNFMPLKLRKAHTKNDRFVMKLYGLSNGTSESEIVKRLFEMYANEI